MKTARLMVAASEQDANLLYATGFFAPDPFIYFELASRRYMVLSDLEIDRARRQASVDRVLSLSRFQRKFGVRALGDLLPKLLREFGVRVVEVPANFPIGFAKRLRGLKVVVIPDPFFPAREIKTPLEQRQLATALRLAEDGLRAGLHVIRRSRIGRDRYLYWQGQRLTSELVQGVINAAIASCGGSAAHTIVAGGNQGCDPHETGHGPLRAHQPIILDIFPRDLKTGYWGDITRTVVRGRASERVRTMFRLVAKAQDTAFDQLRAGINGQMVHGAVCDLFDRHGFTTGRKGGRMQGFFHGTGHGVGLEIHEAPRVAPVPAILQAGNVVTVEPGLYYPGTGGVRLEDMVVISARGCRNLTHFPKYLEI